jgi:gamma-glutamyltranspeptidase/glutathione hydrolase
MVVSASEEASKIGVEIMKKGGNTFDAMVATN